MAAMGNKGTTGVVYMSIIDLMMCFKDTECCCLIIFIYRLIEKGQRGSASCTAWNGLTLTCAENQQPEAVSGGSTAVTSFYSMATAAWQQETGGISMA